MKPHLYGAGHCAEGEHGGTVLYGGLAVKRSLSVNEEHSYLSGRHETTVIRSQPQLVRQSEGLFAVGLIFFIFKRVNITMRT